MSRFLAICALAVLAAVPITAVEAKKKHSHPIQTMEVTDTASIAPFGFEFALAFCPSGYEVTGGGFSSDLYGFATVAETNKGSASFGIIFSNENPNSGGTITAKAICIKGKTKAKKASRSDVREAFETQVAAMERAKHRNP